MSDLIKKADTLLNENRPQDALDLLCDAGVPDTGEVCARMARAYLLRGDTKGDIYSANFFALRAQEKGFSEAWVQEIIDQCQPVPSAVEAAHKHVPHYQMGADYETREEGVTPYSFQPISQKLGIANQPKDFDWCSRNVPCQEACPAKTDIPSYLTAIYEGDYEKAYNINLECNVFPAVLGRVCARPCEEKCRHGWDGLGESVAICFSKRSAADLRKQEPVIMKKWFHESGKKVAVIGSGPSGLAAARNLALYGHEVTVYEKHNKPGGMMNQGIPEFRLPRDIIAREISQIEGLGVKIQCNTAIGEDITLDQLQQDFDAVVMAAGTLRRNLLNLPGNDLEGIRHGLDFLLEVNETDQADIGEHVVVIGGGFTAMDCARAARRLGATTVELDAENEKVAVEQSILRMPAEKVRVWYRRSMHEMLVTPGELEELEQEGIPMEFMVSPKEYIGADGKLTHMRFVRTEMGEPDASGRRRPVEIAGSEFDVPVDTVLLATGQFPDTSWIDGELREKLVDTDQWLKSGESARTAVDNIFVAGDFAQGASSLIQAIGHAKQTARDVDFFLMGEVRIVDQVEVTDAAETGRIREMDYVPVQKMPTIPLSLRDLKSEVETGFTPELSVDETQRCYRCHYKFEIDTDKCIYCDWCVKAKPRPECILKVKKLHYDEDGKITGWDESKTNQDTHIIWINQEDCIRCGACVAACPVDAISIQKVSRQTVPVSKPKASGCGGGCPSTGCSSCG